MFQVLQKIASIPINNSVSEKPTVECKSDGISMVFSTLKHFDGRTFVKGYVRDDNCIQTGNHQEQHIFTIKFNQCGLRRSREYNGIRITTTVIVSFHPIFLTQVDRAYRLSCFYMESSKTVTQQLQISMMTTEEVQRQTPMPVCRYEILRESATGVQVRYAKIGDKVYHRWTCFSETKGLYCMRVHSCTVSDGQGGERVLVVDKKGCSVDKYLLMDLQYTDDLTAGQESHVFKFADRPMLYFNCQLELTVKDAQLICANERPVCKDQILVEPSEQAYEQPIATAKEEQVHCIVKNQPDSDFKIKERSYQSNEVKYPPVPGPPAPPVWSSDLLYFQSSPKSGHSFDNNYEDISAESHAEKYSQSEGQKAAEFDEDGIAYKRLIRRKRNSTNQHSSSASATLLSPRLRVANVDLPEQCLTVFDLEDGTSGEMQWGKFDQLLDQTNCSICFSTVMLAVLSAAVPLATVTSVLIFVFRKRSFFLFHDFDK